MIVEFYPDKNLIIRKKMTFSEISGNSTVIGPKKPPAKILGRSRARLILNQEAKVAVVNELSLSVYQDLETLFDIPFDAYQEGTAFYQLIPEREDP